MKLQDRVSHRLKLRDLRLLLSVMEFGGMAKAAAHLNLTQSGVSKAIADIEHMLNVRLFDRTSRGVEPTLYGLALRKWGTAMFDDLRQGLNEIEHLADPTTGELRIGCTEAMTAGFVSAVIDRLTRQYPRLILRVTQDEPLRLQDLHLHERKIELVVGRIQSPFAQQDMQAEVLFKEPALVVAGVQNKWVHRRKIELAELIDEPWCLPPPESLSGSHLQRAFRANGLDYPPRSTVVALSTQLHASLVATGRYIGILPGAMLWFCGKRLSLKVLPVELPIQPRLRSVGIVTLKNRTLSPVAQLFIDCAREVAKPLAKHRP
ncbi:MAG TPA: LysR family transcriptional regulator [Xanthobacteraceae bacterium]|jgi:DNA-binding transcriptional LysR family regulator|nr:LysR family transcriptional regulator [Xanthobacteraceae bacterium]